MAILQHTVHFPSYLANLKDIGGPGILSDFLSTCIRSPVARNGSSSSSREVVATLRVVSSYPEMQQELGTSEIIAHMIGKG